MKLKREQFLEENSTSNSLTYPLLDTPT